MILDYLSEQVEKFFKIACTVPLWIIGLVFVSSVIVLVSAIIEWKNNKEDPNNEKHPGE